MADSRKHVCPISITLTSMPPQALKGVSLAPRGGRLGLGFEIVEYPLYQSCREGVGGDAAGAGDVEADGFAVQIHQGAAAKPGAQHGVVLDGLLESFRALADFAGQATQALLRINLMILV